jgi:hypothetical protein
MPVSASSATSSPACASVTTAEPRDESIFSALPPPPMAPPFASRSIERPSTFAAPASVPPTRPSMIEPFTVRIDTLLVALSTVSTRRVPNSSSM